ncbi:hypothetical protein BACSP_00738 [Bacillus sp. T2.9-1]|nr:hypothetical protein BACSP_00738 [Bacillus sp. T2.9-1]
MHGDGIKEIFHLEGKDCLLFFRLGKTEIIITKQYSSVQFEEYCFVFLFLENSLLCG